ncbi:MAG: tryptophan--tRNA ligase [Patescibacteria group bacterium]|nr:tryptophan--tRNA ligase [Patescibacteria group bacterium]
MTEQNRKKIVISGIQPSGRSHIGNWAGAFRHWLELQDDPQYECSFFIADYHSLSGEYDPKEKRAQILDMMTDLLAIGLDPDKCTLFRQSDIAEHTELCWVFNTLTPIAFLERMTQFKDKAGQQKENVNMGLLDYPVLQAADILIHKGELVPVGRDQIQHVELTRDMARFFNRKYGCEEFPESKPLLTETPKLRSLTDPLKKMSKSHGEKTFLALDDDPETLKSKLSRAVTETTGRISMTEKQVEEQMALLPEKRDEGALRGQAGVWNLLTILRLTDSEDAVKQVLENQPIKYSELKSLVAEKVADYFADFRAKKAEFKAKPDEVREIFDKGAKKSRKTAQATMKQVRKIIGIR